MTTLLIQCCEFRYLNTPSGRRLSHSRFCAKHPGKRITLAEAREAQHRERMARIMVRPKSTPVVRGGTPGRMTVWLSHPVGCTCDAGCAYVNDHLDDEDGDA